jgi:hypothetical protein
LVLVERADALVSIERAAALVSIERPIQALTDCRTPLSS